MMPSWLFGTISLVVYCTLSLLQGDLIIKSNAEKHLEKKKEDLELDLSQERSLKEGLQKDVKRLKAQVEKLEGDKEELVKEKDDLKIAYDQVENEKANLATMLKESQSAVTLLEQENERLNTNATAYADYVVAQTVLTAKNIVEQVKLLNPNAKLENVSYLHCVRNGRLVTYNPDTQEEEPVDLISAMDTDHATVGQEEVATEAGGGGEKNSGDMSIP